MKEHFGNLEGSVILSSMTEAIREHKQYLSTIDGAIGDGDHGINMSKGFSLAKEALDQEPGDLSHGLLTLSKVLMMRIGGAMGPIYGRIFKSMGKTFEGKEQIDGVVFGEALREVKKGMEALSPARVGDKTLVDALYPAIDAFTDAMEGNSGFPEALGAMKAAAERGRDNTENMISRLGRSSRLGERSRGVVDAGAASCALLLAVMADSIHALLADGS